MKDLRTQIREVINNRPYYICKVSDEHKDLQSQIGSMINQYSRKEDRLNEEYLEERLLTLFESYREEVEREAIAKVIRLINSRPDSSNYIDADEELEIWAALKGGTDTTEEKSK